jgi:four helix bundle protein
MKDFRDLLVWQKAMKLAETVYVLSKNFPSDERFGLTSQIRRCAVSVPSNIAEGSKRKTKKDFAQFLRIASGSLAELETQCILASTLLSVEIVSELEQVKEVQRMLEGLLKKMDE